MIKYLSKENVDIFYYLLHYFRFFFINDFIISKQTIIILHYLKNFTNMHTLNTFPSVLKYLLMLNKSFPN